MKKHLKKHILSVTIGIPAHNESANIAYLLDSIVKQNAKTYRLEKVYVICDGCIDNTAEKVKPYINKYHFIKILNDGKRMGKAIRLNQLYQINKSEIVISIDGDTVLASDDAIENMIKFFKQENVVWVSGNKQPAKAENFTESVINAWLELWYEVRREVNGGHNIYNASGCFLALDKYFAKNIKYPSDITSISPYLFYLISLKNFGFRFAEDAIVIFRSPNNMLDYLLQAKRQQEVKNHKLESFIKEVTEQTRAPLKLKLAVLLKVFLNNPIFTMFAILLHIATTFLPERPIYLSKRGIWATAASTKRAIKIIQ